MRRPCLPWLKDENMGLAVGMRPLEASVFFSWMQRADRYARENVHGFRYEDVCGEGEKQLRNHGGVFFRLRSKVRGFFINRRIRRNPFGKEPCFYSPKTFISEGGYNVLKETVFGGDLLEQPKSKESTEMFFADFITEQSDEMSEEIREEKETKGKQEKGLEEAVERVNCVLKLINGSCSIYETYPNLLPQMGGDRPLFDENGVGVEELEGVPESKTCEQSKKKKVISFFGKKLSGSVVGAPSTSSEFYLKKR